MSLTPQAYKFQAPTGVPGDIVTPGKCSVEPVKFAEAYIPAAFGVAVAFVSGEPRKIPSGSAATVFQGVLVREIPQIGGSVASDQTFDSGVPWFEQVLGLLVNGQVAVKCVAGTPARGGVVYMQVTANGGVDPGYFRADGTDGGNAVALTATQAQWETDGVGPDGQGNTNIAILRVAR